MAVDLKASRLYTNRELSWLAFNRRVLALATRSDVPLIERLKFIAITASNLDEFVMVRVGGLEGYRMDYAKDRFEPGPDGLSLEEILENVWQQTAALTADVSAVLSHQLWPALAEHGVQLLPRGRIDPGLEAQLRAYYEAKVHPCLTPIALDNAHSFPSPRNGALGLVVEVEPVRGAERTVERPDGPLLAVVQLPASVRRFLAIPSDDHPFRFVALEDIMARFAESLFVGHRIVQAIAFRVTRASDLDIDEDGVDDLMSSIEDELRRRDRGAPVRLEIDARAPEGIMRRLRDALGLEPRQVQRVQGLIDPSALFSIFDEIRVPALRDEPHTPIEDPTLQHAAPLFRAVREQDILLHHPYESFRHVVDFIEQAAADPDVVAIKQTLYRTSGDSPIVRALQRAAEAGKEVTALVELKARFDEANNINWARQLEESGANVVYGLIGLKTHCKMLLITRREDGRLQRYLHLSTGNYNPKTANLYTDLSLLTADEDLTHDAMLLFNVLTGYADLPDMRRLSVAPFTLRRNVLDRIDNEIANAKRGRPSGIRAKMNALVDGQVIEALYRASQAGVTVDLVVRGICCLRPQIPGVSDNIRVRSILDRFLEHARVFWWANGGEPEVFLSSADWMPRNLNKRIEVGFPIDDEQLKQRVEDILQTEWYDNTFGWDLGPEGHYTLRTPNGAEPFRAQMDFVERARRCLDAPRADLRPELAQLRRLSPAVRAAHAQLRRLG